MDDTKEHHTTQGPITVTYTSSEPVVTYTSSEPTVTYTTTEPTVTYTTTSEPTVTYTSEPIVTYTKNDPIVTYTTTESTPVVTYTTTRSEPVVTYTTKESPQSSFTTITHEVLSNTPTVSTVTSTAVVSTVPTDINGVPKEAITTDRNVAPAYLSEKTGHLETKEGLHDVSADSNEQGNVEEYDAQGNLINFVMSPGEKSLIRKLDFMYVMPYICVLNFLQVLQIQVTYK